MTVAAVAAVFVMNLQIIVRRCGSKRHVRAIVETLCFDVRICTNLSRNVVTHYENVVEELLIRIA